jgi:alkanesulfonate monooxygenase SsuD/methylene tetrahydromethanopterin reductase-like flavin-dependent oxidoreductase (luciferase family)
VAEAWSRNDRAAATRAVTDAMIEATSVVGTADQCREKIEAYRESGIDLPIVSPFARGAESKAVFEAVIRACAPG